MVQGAAVGVVIPRGLDHQPVRRAVMGAVVVAVARVVALSEIGQDLADGAPAVIVIGTVLDDDHVEIGLLVPAAGGPGAEEETTASASVWATRSWQRSIAAGRDPGG